MSTTTGIGVRLTAVTQRFGATLALDDVSFDLRPGVVTGLLGRNGSGKTTLALLLAAFRRPTSGTLLVDGEDPWENERVLPHICLIRESGDLPSEERQTNVLHRTADRRPFFDSEFAAELMDTFRLDPRRRIGTLSRGQRSAFGIVVGLATRAPLTVLDEVHLGLDAPTRYAFYDALIADYAAYPRTILLSSHLIDEVDRLLEDVAVLDQGRLLAACDVESLRADAVAVTGPAEAVEAFAAGRDVLGRERLGGTLQVRLRARLDEDDVTWANRSGLELGPVGLQDLFVGLTRTEDNK